MQLPPVDRSPNWRPPGADLYSTGASGAPPVRPVNAPTPVESLDRLGEGATARTPDRSPTAEAPPRDWTVDRKREAVEQPPPREPPMYKQLLEFIQSMWRASGSAIEIAQELNRTTQQERLAQQAKSPTYPDPKVKRTDGA
ncbi:hypothetical protein D8B23_02005 [Verminephrobacter aporrectodeae subsp. tuberculatae]|uniref:Uncharacterized protein n=1 Tax=Verminephrobacter aporrectodeae subsp. tuberculatae TaxID=1110392 RepID=A0ABT3KU98_9BURK|nr:hypothetical protein [Verminephrobacter aporrectodeae]MCW5222845.1 hypothetical protein [Verminephrobacter aporrectodeae subsp. tuberculatae]MCW5256938.1 hypothetical protein [Verminephrobacter aporrectodeae subsp. tuberculatae]MCW5288309.1 hypothetical protein [Verminephrobacter aporrectodeae subsp. tuberculatae]MCW5321850.1 hypothetical protein [Verminephrobacter aporrectodeae subsp. tuberculatae]MCW8163431.1 hypothetical protein [Verminephrobacter aporrectodeae subsp. tuberculatae]